MDNIFNLINEYGVYIVFVIVLLEYACFPLPSEIVLPLSGGIAYECNINPLFMIILCTISGIIGTTICYALGYIGKNKLLNKFTKSKDRNESSSFYSKYGNIAISVGRLIPFCRTYISFVAGANKHKLHYYIFFSTIGIIVWNSILILLGYLFYDNLNFISDLYTDYKIIIFIILGILTCFIIIKKVKRKYHFSS